MKKPGIGIRFILLLVLSALIFPVLSFPQDNTKDRAAGLTASLDKDTVKTGSIVKLTLSFNLPQGATIPSPPVIKGLEAFTIADQQIHPGKITLSLFAGQPGLLKTGELSLSYLDKQKTGQTLTTAPISIKVLSGLGDKPEKAQLRSIQGIIPTKSLFLKYWPWVCAVIVAIIAGFFLFRCYMKLKRKKLLLEYADPPHIRAKKAIEKLDASGLFENGEVKKFYFGFSEIIKRYLENIRGFPALEYTTEEISSHIDNEKDRQILSLLRHSDLVKFADDMPTVAHKKEEVTAALKYIDETAPVYEKKDVKENSGETGK